MTLTIFLLIFFFLIAGYLQHVIVNLNIGNKNENDKNYWMLTYDFKPEKIKNIFDLEDKKYIRNRKFKNLLRTIFYFVVIIIFYLLNSLVTHIMLLLSN